MKLLVLLLVVGITSALEVIEEEPIINATIVNQGLMWNSPNGASFATPPPSPILRALIGQQILATPHQSSQYYTALQQTPPYSWLGGNYIGTHTCIATNDPTRPGEQDLLGIINWNAYQATPNPFPQAPDALQFIRVTPTDLIATGLPSLPYTCSAYRVSGGTIVDRKAAHWTINPYAEQLVDPNNPGNYVQTTVTAVYPDRFDIQYTATAQPGRIVDELSIYTYPSLSQTAYNLCTTNSCTLTATIYKNTLYHLFSSDTTGIYTADALYPT